MKLALEVGEHRDVIVKIINGFVIYQCQDCLKVRKESI